MKAGFVKPMFLAVVLIGSYGCGADVVESDPSLDEDENKTDNWSAPELCSLPAAAGDCEGYFPSWFHSTATGQCEEFVYGGCDGNENRFGTREECESACTAPEPNICLLPAAPGDCEGLFPSWFHNTSTGQCEEFVYGGCDGNENRFGTREECESACTALEPDTCSLPAAPGDCEGYFPSWFHSTATGQCEEFVYGGCEGNENRFGTREECESACPAAEPDMCSLPAAPGDCEGLFPSWFHNTATGQCEEFDYGGCDGNENRFGTREECESACVI